VLVASTRGGSSSVGYGLKKCKCFSSRVYMRTLLEVDASTQTLPSLCVDICIVEHLGTSGRQQAPPHLNAGSDLALAFMLDSSGISAESGVGTAFIPQQLGQQEFNRFKNKCFKQY
jgi:hypothetical protein